MFSSVVYLLFDLVYSTHNISQSIHHTNALTNPPKFLTCWKIHCFKTCPDIRPPFDRSAFRNEYLVGHVTSSGIAQSMYVCRIVDVCIAFKGTHFSSC